jgi:hypothetical protein
VQLAFNRGDDARMGMSERIDGDSAQKIEIARTVGGMEMPSA